MSRTYALTRTNRTTYGWAILTADGQPLVVDGNLAVGLTRWEGRQIMGWMGLA
jgi:hypothetical protein